MVKIVFSILFCVAFLKADFIDDDMDGVSNKLDQCPNTPFMALVDKNGCVTKKIDFEKDKSLDISIGYYHAKIDDTYSQNSKSINLIYSYDKYTFILNSSRYDINQVGSGQDDTTIGAFYTFDNSIYSQIGMGVYLPTSDTVDNKTDYFIRAKFLYSKEQFDTTFSYTRTFMKDIGTVDANSYIVSFGYSFSNKFYSSLSYNSSDSIYTDSGRLNYLSLYLEYYLTDDIYISTTYSDGQSSDASDYSYSFDIGYKF